MRRPTVDRLALAMLAVFLVAGCGGGSSPAPAAPDPPPTGGGGTPTPSTATITIGADGRVAPSAVSILRGGRVTFVNNDSRAHDMSSDPHPVHTDCPEMNQVGFLQTGQSGTTAAFGTARTCGFHDHNQPSETGLQGRITITDQ
ncbi:MAG: hypothetical protein R2712_01630 [Vicinamibacterales bacterium]